MKTSTARFLPWLICLLGAVFYCYEFLLRVAPSVMYDDFLHAYGITGAAFGWLVNFYYISYTPMQLPVGILMDRYGPRRLLTFSILLCSIGSFLIASVKVLWVAQFAEFIMGFGSAFAFVGVLKLASNWLPVERLALVSGITTSLGMVGAMIGQSFMNLVRQQVGWQASWFYAGIVGLAILVMMWLVVHDKPSALDPNAQDLEHSKTALDWGRLLTELKNISLNVQFWINGLIGGLLWLPISVFNSVWGVSFLEKAAHLTSTQASTATSLMFLGMGIGGPLAGWLSGRIKKRRILLQVGSAMMALTFGLLLVSPELPYSMICVLTLLTGFFTGAQVLVFAIAVDLTSSKVAGTAASGTNFLVMIGCVLFTPLVGKVLNICWDGSMQNGLPVYSVHAFQIALAMLPIGVAVAFLASFLLKESYPEQVVTEAPEPTKKEEDYVLPSFSQD